MERKRVHLVVHGTVQGVFFRSSTQDQATGRGVAGWVRNTAEGTVEVELEGASDDVEAVVDFVHRGPGAATVEHVEVTELEPTGASGFEVR